MKVMMAFVKMAWHIEKVLLPDYINMKVNLAPDFQMVKEYILGMKIVFTQEIGKKVLNTLLEP